MSMRIAPLALLIAVIGLGACASAPAPAPQDSAEPVAHFYPTKDPYWQDQKWDKALADAVQSVVHDPVDPTGTATPGLHATVKFTYLNGIIEYPEITASTGDSDLDNLILHQIASVQVPKPTGLQTDQPHEFELDLYMSTAFESFQESIYAAIDAWKLYPKDAIIDTEAGNTVVGFSYLDGKANGISLITSSGSKALDKASIGAVTRATLPPAPTAYAGKSVPMQVLFCYTMATALNGPKVTIKNRCPVGKNMIVVQATLVRTITIQRMPGGY
ncbi:MAG TPA: energy transducer TonB [Gammaproteobacteria bacterium]|jgi:hypothetical protein